MHKSIAASDARVLILNSNEHVRQIILHVMMAFQFRDFCSVSTPEEAWASLRINKPDLLITDTVGPGLSRLDFVRQVRQAPDSPNPFVPIIVVSADKRRSDVIAAINAGAHEFIGLPLRPLDLARRLDSLILAGRPFVRAANYFGPCRRRRVDPKFDGQERRADPHAAANANKEREDTLARMNKAAS